MSTQLREEVNQYCTEIKGNARLVLNHLAYRAALISESPELFTPEGHRKESRTIVRERQAWISADEWEEWTGLDDQSRNHAVNKLRDTYHLDLRAGQAHRQQAMLYELPPVEVLQAAQEEHKAAKAAEKAKRQVARAHTDSPSRMTPIPTRGTPTPTLSNAPMPITSDTPMIVTHDRQTPITDDTPISHYKSSIRQTNQQATPAHRQTTTPPQQCDCVTEDGQVLLCRWNNKEQRWEPQDRQERIQWRKEKPRLTPIDHQQSA